MATQNSINTKVTNNADGYDQAGGTIARKLTISGSDIAIAGSGTNTYTFPASTSTLASLSLTETLTNKSVVLSAGTSALAPIILTLGTNLTSSASGAFEYDGVQIYGTLDTTSGRGGIPVQQYVHLTANGSAITTISNFFGANSNISLVTSAYYFIEVYFWFVTTGTGATTFTFTNSVAPTSQNIDFEITPTTGITAPPGVTTMIRGQILNDTTAARTIVTSSLSAATHFAHVKIWLKNSTGTSLKIQATAGSTNLTPQIGSVWTCTRISPNNIGTLSA